MGGHGSGNWYRWNTATTLEETKRIDIRYMRKQGFLAQGMSGSLRWHVGDKPSGDIRFTTTQDYLQINYRYREHGGEWHPIEQRINFDRTPCNYGGERMWFLCPRCNHRVGVLSGHGALFLCRKCHQLPYASENEGRNNKLFSRKHKLGKRIFEHYECGQGYGKKKGMHWKTFERLQGRYEQNEASIMRVLDKM